MTTGTSAQAIDALEVTKEEVIAAPIEARPVEFVSRVGPVPMRARATAGEILLHMALHEVQHRAGYGDAASVRGASGESRLLDPGVCAYAAGAIVFECRRRAAHDSSLPSKVCV